MKMWALVGRCFEIVICTICKYILEFSGYSRNTVETLYSTIYYSKYFIELNFDKSTEYVAL